MNQPFKSSSIRNKAENVKYKNMKTYKNILKENESYQNLASGEIVATSADNSKSHFKAHFNNGFIGTIFDAYNNHNNLQLKPDDVWLAILTQFSLYVNKNSEALRNKFVSHKGKIEISVVQWAELKTADYSKLVREITEKCNVYMEENVRDWLIPKFSTTTRKDITIASVVMMSTLQKYFGYKMMLFCGIPNITLLGIPKDWEDIRNRVKDLVKYEIEGSKIMYEWSNMLIKILDEFVLSSYGKSNLEFWDKICSKQGSGSGSRYLSGWITAFTAFDNDGKWMGDEKSAVSWEGNKYDNGIYPLIDTNDVVSGIVSVPVFINDNGEPHDTMMFSGHLSYIANDETTIKPSPEWSLVLVNKKQIEINTKNKY